MQIAPTKWKHSLEQFGLVARRCANASCGKSSLALASVFRRSDCYLLNRRDWLCSPECLESELVHRFERLETETTRPLSLTRMPLGLLLLGRGVVGDQQLRDAIALQKRTGERIGACLCSTGATTEADVVSGLSAQWACPVFPALSVQRGCASLVPAALLRQHEMLPVHFTAASRSLYVAFSHGVDYAALYALEQILGCHTEPCVVPDRVILDELEKRSLTCENERALPYPGSVTEAAHIVACYARQCGAEEVRYVVASQDLWVRVLGRRGFMDITFHRDKE